jgi:hypothetical protein
MPSDLKSETAPTGPSPEVPRPLRASQHHPATPSSTALPPAASLSWIQGIPLNSTRFSTTSCSHTSQPAQPRKIWSRKWSRLARAFAARGPLKPTRSTPRFRTSAPKSTLPIPASIWPPRSAPSPTTLAPWSFLLATRPVFTASKTVPTRLSASSSRITRHCNPLILNHHPSPTHPQQEIAKRTQPRMRL